MRREVYSAQDGRIIQEHACGRIAWRNAFNVRQKIVLENRRRTTKFYPIMPMRVEDIAEEALALPSEARALLANRLVESLDPAEDEYVHDLWATEAQRRLHELRSGAVKGIPGEDASARLRRKYIG